MHAVRRDWCVINRAAEDLCWLCFSSRVRHLQHISLALLFFPINENEIFFFCCTTANKVTTGYVSGPALAYTPISEWHFFDTLIPPPLFFEPHKFFLVSKNTEKFSFYRPPAHNRTCAHHREQLTMGKRGKVISLADAYRSLSAETYHRFSLSHICRSNVWVEKCVRSLEKLSENFTADFPGWMTRLARDIWVRFFVFFNFPFHCCSPASKKEFKTHRIVSGVLMSMS